MAEMAKNGFFDPQKPSTDPKMPFFDPLAPKIHSLCPHNIPLLSQGEVGCVKSQNMVKMAKNGFLALKTLLQTQKCHFFTP